MGTDPDGCAIVAINCRLKAVHSVVAERDLAGIGHTGLVAGGAGQVQTRRTPADVVGGIELLHGGAGFRFDGFT